MIVERAKNLAMERPPFMISYAQNGEDVLLGRALAEKILGGRGADIFWVDVGAGYPHIDSTTAHFYDVLAGHGINIEPDPTVFPVLAAARPRDVNLQCCVGTRPGTATLVTFPDVWGWATVNGAVSAQHRQYGHRTETFEVPVRTLDSVLAEHVAPGTVIDVLKVDVEGQERDVLESVSLPDWRPRLLVIEATAPNSTVTNHEEWEHLVLTAGYDFAYFDGLNRFYTTAAEPELRQAFATPVCLFDRYVPNRLWGEFPAARRQQLWQQFEWAAGPSDLAALECYERQFTQLVAERRHADRH
jgi:FkbM family methyltransferase